MVHVLLFTYGNLYCYGANNPVRYVDPDGRETAGFNNRQGDYDLLLKFQGINTGDKWYNNLFDGFVSYCLEGTYNFIASSFNLLTNAVGYGIEAYDEVIDWADEHWPSLLTLTGSTRSDIDAFSFVTAANPMFVAEGLSCLSEIAKYISISSQTSKYEALFFNQLKEYINRGEIKGNNIITKLDDNLQIVFRKDFGENVHPIHAYGYTTPVNHYNIEIQKLKKNGGYKTCKDYHIIVDENNDIVEFF